MSPSWLPFHPRETSCTGPAMYGRWVAKGFQRGYESVETTNEKRQNKLVTQTAIKLGHDGLLVHVEPTAAVVELVHLRLASHKRFAARGRRRRDHETLK